LGLSSYIAFLLSTNKTYAFCVTKGQQGMPGYKGHLLGGSAAFGLIYLARNYPCTHCKDLWIYSWQAEFTPQQLHEKLLAKIGHRMRISDLLVSKRDKAGLVQEVLVHGATPVPVAGKELYTLCKEIKSFCYTIERKKDTILLKGKGYGHHLGLCQWGARQMVADHWDWDYRRILHFYYPQTKLMRFV